MSRWLHRQFGISHFSWPFFAIGAVLVVMAVLSFLNPGSLEKIIPRKFWALVLVVSLVASLTLRQWRFRAQRMDSLHYRGLATWFALILCMAMTSLLVLVKPHLSAVELRLQRALAWSVPVRADYLASGGTGTPVRGEHRPSVSSEQAAVPTVESLTKRVENEIKEIKEDVSHWGTLFAWLIAVFGLVVAFVTSWVLGIAKDVKSQVDESRAALDLSGRMEAMSHSLALRSAHEALTSRKETLDPESNFPALQFCVSLQSTLRTASAALDPMADLEKLAKDLEKHHLTLVAMLSRPMDPHTVRPVITRHVLPCLSQLHARLADDPRAMGSAGESAISWLAKTYRCCLDL